MTHSSAAPQLGCCCGEKVEVECRDGEGRGETEIQIEIEGKTEVEIEEWAIGRWQLPIFLFSLYLSRERGGLLSLMRPNS